MPRDYRKIALTEERRTNLLEEADVMRFASVGAGGLPHGFWPEHLWYADLMPCIDQAITDLNPP